MADIVRALVAVVVLGALLNVPSWAGMAGQGGFGSRDGQLGAPRSGDSDVMAPIPRAGAAAPATIQFPLSGGTDSSYVIRAPRGSNVLTASMELEGSPALPSPQWRSYDIADTDGSGAWEGAASSSEPGGGPGSYQQMKFEPDGIADVRSEDQSTHGTLTYGPGFPYQLFKFNVTEDSVSTMWVRWVGIGWDMLVYSTEFRLYIYKMGKWEPMASHSEGGIGENLFTVNRTFPSPSGSYIDACGMAYILVEGPSDLIASMIETDFIGIGVLGAYEEWPTDLALDMGGDGTVEFQQPGEFRGKATVGPEMLAGPLQRIIDDSDPALDNVSVPLVFSSATGGKLAIGGAAFEFDMPPAFSPVPSEACRFDEDTSAPALLDLDRYFRDDRTAHLAYDVVIRPDDQRILCGLDTDGRHMSFWTTSKDWSGTREFGITATDCSNLTCTGFINVTIDPVNDPPAITPIPDQTAMEDSPFTFVARAVDVDDPSANITFSDDCRLFDIGPSSGVISFTPNNSQVGTYQVTLTAWDTHGAVGSAPFMLAVQNVNDAPVMDCPDELRATEHKRFLFRMAATDEDAGDRVAYSVESDIDGLMADPASGEIDVVFGEEDVGEHQIDLVATDIAGAEDRRTVLLFVENVNDPPAIEAGCELNITEGEEFDYTVRASDPDKGDSLEFSVDTDRLWIDPDSGRIRFTPSNADVGRLKFRVTAKDAAGLAAEARFVLNIININEPPADLKILSPRAGTVYAEGQDMLFNASAVDPDRGAVLTYTWLDGGSLIGRGPGFSARLCSGRHVITLVVSDGELNASASAEIDVRRAGPLQGFGPTIAQIAAVALVLTAGAAAGAAMARRRRRKSAPKSEKGLAQPAPQGQAGNSGATEPKGATPDPRAPATGDNGSAAGAAPSGQPGGIAGAAAPQVPPPPATAPLQPPGVPPWWPPSGPAPPWAAYAPQAYPPPAFGPYAYPGQGYPAGEYPGVQPPAARATARDEQAPDTDSPPAHQGLEVPDDDGLVTRDAMRTAVADAKQAIQAAKNAGMDAEECDRLLSEAIAASYRMDYPRARGLARKAETVATAMLERTARGPQQPKT